MGKAGAATAKSVKDTTRQTSEELLARCDAALDYVQAQSAEWLRDHQADLTDDIALRTASICERLVSHRLRAKNPIKIESKSQIEGTMIVTGEPQKPTAKAIKKTLKALNNDWEAASVVLHLTEDEMADILGGE